MTSGSHSGQVFISGENRFPQDLQNNLVSHSGQRVQCSLTGDLQFGQKRSSREVSHAGQNFQFGLTGSLQLGHNLLLSSIDTSPLYLPGFPGIFLVSGFGKTKD
jgi:hypothetical protein